MWGTTQGSRRPGGAGARTLRTVGTSLFCNMAMSGSALLLAGALSAPADSSVFTGHNVPWTKPSPPALMGPNLSSLNASPPFYFGGLNG